MGSEDILVIDTLLFHVLLVCLSTISARESISIVVCKVFTERSKINDY